MGGSVGKGIADSLPTQSSLHVVMLGLDSAGKTTVLYRLKFDQYLSTVPTIGFNCEKIKATSGKAKGTSFLIWDVGGQDKLRPLWKSYTRCTDGIVFVLDSVDCERMEEAKIELTRISRENPSVPVLVLANKQDLPGARDPADIEKALSLSELNALYHVQPACAIIGDGLDDGLEHLYEMILKRKKLAKQQKKAQKSRWGNLADAQAGPSSAPASFVRTPEYVSNSRPLETAKFGAGNTRNWIVSTQSGDDSSSRSRSLDVFAPCTPSHKSSTTNSDHSEDAMGTQTKSFRKYPNQSREILSKTQICHSTLPVPQAEIKIVQENVMQDTRSRNSIVLRKRRQQHYSSLLWLIDEWNGIRWWAFCHSRPAVWAFDVYMNCPYISLHYAVPVIILLTVLYNIILGPQSN